MYAVGTNGHSFSQSVQNSGSNQNATSPSVAEKNGESSEPPPTKTRKPYVITKQRERWTPEEHERFLEALQIFGRQWRKIEEYIGTKTAVQIRSHAQKFFTKIEREGNKGGKGPDGKSNGMSIYIPPPRPKRKPSHPYPKKAKVPNCQENGEKAPKRESAKNKNKSNKDKQCLERNYSLTNGQKKFQYVPPPAKSEAGNGLVGQNGMMPVKMLDNVPYLTWLSSLSGLNKVPQGMAGSVGNVVMPTPHKILPGVVPLAGHGYDVNELMHMQKLLVNAADTSGTKEEKEQALAAAKIIQQQVLSVKAIQASANNSSKVPTTSSPPTSSLGSFTPAPIWTV